MPFELGHDVPFPLAVEPSPSGAQASAPPRQGLWGLSSISWPVCPEWGGVEMEHGETLQWGGTGLPCHKDT